MALTSLVSMSSPGMASDLARFRHSQVPNTLAVEKELFALVGKDIPLSRRSPASPPYALCVKKPGGFATRYS